MVQYNAYSHMYTIRYTVTLPLDNTCSTLPTAHLAALPKGQHRIWCPLR